MGQANNETRWRKGERDPRARAAHNEACRQWRHKWIDLLTPRDQRVQLLARVADGERTVDTCKDLGLQLRSIRWLARTDATFGELLYQAEMEGRDPTLKHGTESAYKAMCRCPECRANHHDPK